MGLMERGFLEHLVGMYADIQALEDAEEAGGGLAAMRPRLEALCAHARGAPAGLRALRPSVPWGRLASLDVGDKAAAGFAIRELAPLARNAVLSEFGLGSGRLVFAGRTGASFAVIFDTVIDGSPGRCLFLDGVLSSAEHADGSPALLYPPLVIRSFGLLKGQKRGLVLGVAGGTMVEILKREFPMMHVDGVDIDAAVMELGKEYFSLREDKRTALHACDARSFVEAAEGGYDIVVMDAFAGISPVPHLATVEFAQAVRSRMSPGGVCAVNIIARCERSGYLQFAFDTWRMAFRNVFAFPLCREGELFNIVLIATDGDAGGFAEENRGDIYAMEFDPSRVLRDEGNRIRELSPY